MLSNREWMDLRRQAADIKRLRGVNAVFAAGSRRKPRIDVHVDADEFGTRLPKRFGALSLRVVPATPPACHYIDLRDEVWQADGPAPRDSTMTAILRKRGVLYVLASGHGVAPYGSNNRLVRQFSKDDAAGTVRVTINDGSGGFFTGSLMAASVASRRAVDFGVFTVRNVDDANYDPWHPATGVAAPHPVRTEPLALGEPVWQVSRFQNRPQRVTGTVSGLSLTLSDVTLPDGTMGQYASVIAVEPTNSQAFSVPGESGSLVVDNAQHVVGTVLAGKPGGPSYVLPAGALMAVLSNNAFDGFLVTT